MKIVTVADKYQGKRLNSPNDVVYRLDGSFYFTDPPYGLPKGDDDPAKELKFNAVFRMANGTLEPVIKDLSRPNGIAISPDQKTLYIGNSDEKNRIWMAYEIADDGTVSHGRLFADVTTEKDAGVPDGMTPAPGVRFADFSWHPSSSEGEAAEIVEFAYNGDARLFTIFFSGNAPETEHLSSGVLWSVQNTWLWRVWSISESGAVSFSSARSFKH